MFQICLENKDRGSRSFIGLGLRSLRLALSCHIKDEFPLFNHDGSDTGRHVWTHLRYSTDATCPRWEWVIICLRRPEKWEYRGKSRVVQGIRGVRVGNGVRASSGVLCCLYRLCRASSGAFIYCDYHNDTNNDIHLSELT